ncbi:hypothetical protein K458DRAFT_42825 [Lentithecium fluviatile CBS 122367]|uniref:Nephrocystin 3-like N-terminal domain-containing protein n=1 Tax=Lentithecium fluviatile CBS 122367 TaxID=1168545 RepID=A0A6G1IZZ7_9PLEO|nr:hypothetical protein K458DRAFT_42825 [Lentithecium fluviatile CBS 122367]
MFGIPGWSKSILSSSIIDDLQKECEAENDRAVIYFYFDLSDARVQKRDAMVRPIVSQLQSRCIRLPLNVMAYYNSFGASNQPCPPSVLVDLVRTLVKEYVHTYVVLDALDECSDRDGILEFLTELISWKSETLHLLHTIRLQNDAVDKDIQVYARHELGRSRWRRAKPLIANIETELCTKSQEIAEAVAIDPDRTPGFDPDECLEDPMDCRAICSNLVTVITPVRSGGHTDPTSEDEIDAQMWKSQIVLAHYSVVEYLTSSRIRSGLARKFHLRETTSHLFIAMSCIAYFLQIQVPQLGPRDVRANAPLARYAGDWVGHAVKSGTEEDSPLATHLLAV